MAEDTAPTPSETSKNALDLNSLSGLDFGPNWADESASKHSTSKGRDKQSNKKDRSKRRATSSSRDRRSRDRTSRKGDEQGGPGQSQGKRGFGRGHSRPDFEPTVKVDLYPQDEAFDALVKRLQASARTYQLFEIAQLLLAKPERYVVVVRSKERSGPEKEAPPSFYYSVPGHLPFKSEDQAINYVLKEHLDLFFEVEEIEVEPPSGNFQIVNRCGITGDLLGPPNYHRYQEFIQQHYTSRISNMSFERFQSKIVGSKEQSDIDEWLNSMRKGFKYTVKDRQEGEPESLETLESARRFLLQHRKDKVLGSGDSVRFAGRDIERMPMSDIRRSVESYIEQQKHFPLDSANNIRGRLRRHNFTVYKKGNKGVSYVCAVKRKFRDSKTVFTESISDLINFIEKNPEIPASKLSKEYIGIDTEKQKPEALKMQESPAGDASNAAEKSEAEAPATETEPNADAGTGEAENKAASTEAKPVEELSPAEKEKLNQLMMDLRWLITEGYVTEYGDGRLFAPPPLPEASKKNEVSSKSTTGQVEEDKAPQAKSPATSEGNDKQSPEDATAEEETKQNGDVSK